MFGLGFGVKTKNTNLRGIGISRALAKIEPSASLTNAMAGFFSDSMAPHKVRQPSESSGSLFMIGYLFLMLSLANLYISMMEVEVVNLSLDVTELDLEGCEPRQASISMAEPLSTA